MKNILKYLSTPLLVLAFTAPMNASSDNLDLFETDVSSEAKKTLKAFSFHSGQGAEQIEINAGEADIKSTLFKTHDQQYAQHAEKEAKKFLQIGSGLDSSVKKIADEFTNLYFSGRKFAASVEQLRIDIRHILLPTSFSSFFKAVWHVKTDFFDAYSSGSHFISAVKSIQADTSSVEKVF